MANKDENEKLLDLINDLKSRTGPVVYPKAGMRYLVTEWDGEENEVVVQEVTKDDITFSYADGFTDTVSQMYFVFELGAKGLAH
jgi:hypothetical protein